MRLFDMHCDTIYECDSGGHRLFENRLQLDLKRGMKYDSWGQVFAVWMNDNIRGEDAWLHCRRMLELAHSEAAVYSDYILIANSPKDITRAIASHRCAAILAVEGGSALAGRTQTLELMKELGVKIITLTWNGSNELGHGSGSGCSDGLTDFGKNAIRAMESFRILPDVSHLNAAGFWDVMEYASGPVIASHSVSSSVFEHPRNLSDEQFAAISHRGGLVGITLCGEQLGEQSFECIERHLDHYLSLYGRSTVAFGCDFDGTDIPPDWGGIEVMSQIYEYLQRKNYDESLIDRLFFGNCYDFFTEL